MGLGMALAAELNKYPGPRHVLELGPALGLSVDQESKIQAIFDEMQNEARSFGRLIVELERDLDQTFVEGTISEACLGRIARSRRAESCSSQVGTPASTYPPSSDPD